MSEPTVRSARPRIVDVATRAGVSRQTVSNVINAREGFTEETRAKVEAAIAELGFQPNRYAQSLRSLRTMLLGFEMSTQQLDVTNPSPSLFFDPWSWLPMARLPHRRLRPRGGERDFAIALRPVSSTASSFRTHPRRLSPSGPGRSRVPFVALGRQLPTCRRPGSTSTIAGNVRRCRSSGCSRSPPIRLCRVSPWTLLERRAAGRGEERLAFHGLPSPTKPR